MTDVPAVASVPRARHRHGVSLAEATGVWLRVAALSFGGPAGQIAVMHRIIVDEKKWVGESRFLHALSYCMLLPGPEAHQLTIYIGWLMHRWPGAIVAGGLFVVPGIVSIMALSYVYAAFGSVPAVAALFFGLKAAVLAIVLQAVHRVGSRALKSRPSRARSAWLSSASFLRRALPADRRGGGRNRLYRRAFRLDRIPGRRRAWRGKARPRRGVARRRIAGTCAPDRRPGLRVSALWLVRYGSGRSHLRASRSAAGSIFTDIGAFFSKMAVVTFGGAYAVLAYMAQQAVETYDWLKPGEMLDGLGMAETTPGPLIMVVQFVGFLAAYRHPGMLPPMLAGTLGGCWRPGAPSCRAFCGLVSARRSSSGCATTSR